MELIRASNTGPLAPVLDWRIEHADPDQGSVTSRLTKDCVSVFRKTMKRLPKGDDLSRERFHQLERSCSSLILWDSGYDVRSGGLDDVLAKSRALRRSTLRHLVNISGALTDRLPPLIDLEDEELGPHRALSSTAAEAKTCMHESFQDGSESDDSDSGSSSISLSSEWDEIAEDLWTDVQCLLDLDPLIKHPAPDLARAPQALQQAPSEWKPHVAYIDRIRARFPNADLTLVDRLGRANWERFLKGNADREKNQNAEAEPAPGVQNSDVEVAGTLAHYTEPISKFHDSGLGTSINTGSAYAETVMSYRQEGGESVKIPPLPKEAKQGKPFECVACGGKLVITNSSAWKKHLYLDLCPWICHDLDCSFGTDLFRTRGDWIDHLGLGHGLAPGWKSFACPMCHENTGDGKVAITRHLSSHMEEISLAALPAGIEEEDDESDSGASDASDSSDARTEITNHYPEQQDTTASQPMPQKQIPFSTAWSKEDDENLLRLRAQGLNWSQVQSGYFGSKTPNACRKRHERLIERRSGDERIECRVCGELGSLAEMKPCSNRRVPAHWSHEGCGEADTAAPWASRRCGACGDGDGDAEMLPDTTPDEHYGDAQRTESIPDAIEGTAGSLPNPPNRDSERLWGVYLQEEERYKDAVIPDDFPDQSGLLIYGPSGISKRLFFYQCRHYGLIAGIIVFPNRTFVQYHTAEGAQAALKGLHGTKMNGRMIYIELLNRDDYRGSSKLAAYEHGDRRWGRPCITCRGDAIHCDFRRPKCAICEARGVVCGGYEDDAVADEKDSRGPDLQDNDNPIADEGVKGPDLQEDDEDPYTIKCICAFPDDDGNTIFCETCETWQHIECFYPDNLEDAIGERFEHLCHECKPRPLDYKRATERTRKLRDQAAKGVTSDEKPELNSDREETMNYLPPPKGYHHLSENSPMGLSEPQKADEVTESLELPPLLSRDSTELRLPDLAGPRKPPERYYCMVEECPHEFGFGNEKERDRHYSAVHSLLKGRESAAEEYRCTLGQCEDKFTLWVGCDNFRHHLRKIHSVSQKQATNEVYLNLFLYTGGRERKPDPAYTAQFPSVDGQEPEEDPDADSAQGARGKRFRTKNRHDRHVHDKHGTARTYYCPEQTCAYSIQGDKSFPRKDHLRLHLLEKHNKIPQPEDFGSGSHVEVIHQDRDAEHARMAVPDPTVDDTPEATVKPKTASGDRQPEKSVGQHDGVPMDTDDAPASVEQEVAQDTGSILKTGSDPDGSQQQEAQAPAPARHAPTLAELYRLHGDVPGDLLGENSYWPGATKPPSLPREDGNHSARQAFQKRTVFERTFTPRQRQELQQIVGRQRSPVLLGIGDEPEVLEGEGSGPGEEKRSGSPAHETLGPGVRETSRDTAEDADKGQGEMQG